MSQFSVSYQELFYGGKWPFQGIQNLAGFVAESVTSW